MKIKITHCIFILFFLLFTGCGNNASSSSQVDTLEKDEKVAVYIPDEMLEPQTMYAKATAFTPLPFSNVSTLIKEDAQRDTIEDKWIVYDRRPEGASISIVYDEQKESRVIAFNGEGLKNGFVLGFWASPGPWKDTEHHIIQWSMNYSEEYYVYVRVSTNNGYRYLYYTPRDHNYGLVNYAYPHYIHHGLGRNSMDGTWRTFTRDLKEDLKAFEPNNELISIDGFFMRGSGEVDDIALLREENRTEESNLSIDDAIHQQIVKDTNYTIIYKDNKRALIQSFSPWRDYYQIGILDISDPRHITTLQNYTFEFRSHLKEIRVQKENYIIIADDKTLSIHDYQSGIRTSSDATDVWSNDKIHYITLEQDYLIYQKGKSLKIVDIRDKERPHSTKLYYGDATSFSLSSDKLSLFAKDAQGNLLKVIKLDGSSFTVREAIEEWAKPSTIDSLKSILIGEPLISENKKRAIVYIHDAPGILSFYHVVLDTSNVQEIKALDIKLCEECGIGSTQKKVMNDDDYILFLRYSQILLYDFNTATLLGSFKTMHPIVYQEIAQDYVTFSYFDQNDTFKFDFSNRTNPTVIKLEN